MMMPAWAPLGLWSALTAGRAAPQLMQAQRAWSSGGGSHTALIKQLRERSGSPISDVKSCLEAADWNLEAAYEALRKKGLAAAAKKASRHAAEGLLGCVVAPSRRSAVVVEVNCETDFVARNDKFQALVRGVAASALSLHHDSSISPTPASSVSGAAGQGVAELSVEQVLGAPVDPSLVGEGASGRAASDAVVAVAAQVRENVRLRRAFRLSTDTGLVSAYLHQSPAPGLCRIASLVLVEPAAGSGSAQALSLEQAAAVAPLAQQVAMHVAGMKPSYVSSADVPSDVLQQQREAGKFLEEAVLLEQRFVLDDTLKVAALVEKMSQAAKCSVRVSGFLRIKCGEGLEAPASKQDFATEVASLARG